MKRTVSIIIFFVVLLLQGCKKEPLPQPAAGEPVFYVDCIAGSSPVRIEAGNDQYRMSPGYYRDSNEVYVLQADLSKNGCVSCNAFTIKVNDHMASQANAPVHIDSTLKPGNYLYNDRSLQPTQYVVKFRPEIMYDPTGVYTWTIIENGEEPVYVSGYNAGLTFNALQSYSVSMRYEDASGCSAQHYAQFNLGFGSQPLVTATRTAYPDLLYSFSASIVGAEPLSYYWEFGDGQFSAEKTPAHTFQPLGGGFYTTTLTVTDAANKSSYAYYQVPASVDPVCSANFITEVTAIPNVKAFSKITIEFTDNNGKLYSTRDFVQPQESKFEIVSVESYKPNKDGHPTKRFKAFFNCLLRSGSEELIITNGEAVVAVAYPE